MAFTEVCRLRLCSGEMQENLGVLIPSDGGYALDTKLPAKRFGQGNLEFYVVPKHDKPSGQFVRVYPEEPFAYIARIKEAYLAYQNGQIGIMLK